MIKKILKIIWGIVKFLVTTIILIIVGIILLQRITNNEASIAGIRIFAVVTESMVPVYNVGDVLLVVEKDKDKIQVGDDIAYLGQEGSYTDKVITHRVVEIENIEGKIYFHTKGVANDEEDPLVGENQVYGTVRTNLQIMSWLNKILNNMYGMYFLIALPIAVIFLFEIKAFREDKKTVEGDYTSDEEEDEEYIKAQKRKEKRAKRRRRYERNE